VKESEGDRDRRGRKTHAPDPHRLLPQSPDSEKGALCSFLLAPNDIGGLFVEQRVNEDWFAVPSHGIIHRRLMQMWNMNEPIDFILLTQFLRDLDELDQCGGAAFISELFTFLPTAANCAYYLEILREKYQLREAIKVCTAIAGRGYDEQDQVPELLDDMEAKVLAIRSEFSAKEQMTTKQAVIEALAQIDSVYSRKGSITGIATGYHEFDYLTDGLHRSEMIVIAGRPSNGKTALAMNIAEFVAITLGKAVGVFSAEMRTRELISRMLCSRSRVNLTRVRDGYLSERDFPALQKAASEISASRIHIDDSNDLTIQELRAKARRMKQRFGIELLMVDYLQLIRSNSKRAADNRQLEVSEVSAGLKNCARELDIPLIVLCQIGRGFEARALDGRPRLSDLRESGAIEQDADLVAFIVRPELYADTEEKKEEYHGKAELIIAKQRNGPVGDVKLTFLSEYARFETRAGEQPEPGRVSHQEDFPI